MSTKTHTGASRIGEAEQHVSVEFDSPGPIEIIILILLAQLCSCLFSG